MIFVIRFPDSTFRPSYLKKKKNYSYYYSLLLINGILVAMNDLYLLIIKNK